MKEIKNSNSGTKQFIWIKQNTHLEQGLNNVRGGVTRAPQTHHDVLRSLHLALDHTDKGQKNKNKI